MIEIGYPVRATFEQFGHLGNLAWKFAVYRVDTLHMSLQSQIGLCDLAAFLNKPAPFGKMPYCLWLSPLYCWLLLRAAKVLGTSIPLQLRSQLFEIARKYKFFNIKKL